MTDLVTISNGAFTARINPLGAELSSLTDPQGRQYMTDADPRYWTGHAPLLFPVVGALRNGSYRLDGRKYALPKHGFARTSRFELVGQAADRVRFRLVESEATLAVYPFRFELQMTLALSGATLSMAATVRNPGAGPLPFSFGFHPAFAWPLPGGVAKDDHAIVSSATSPGTSGGSTARDWWRAASRRRWRAGRSPCGPRCSRTMR